MIQDIQLVKSRLIQKLLSSHTDSHTGPIGLPGPLKSSTTVGLVAHTRCHSHPRVQDSITPFTFAINLKVGISDEE